MKAFYLLLIFVFSTQVHAQNTYNELIASGINSSSEPLKSSQNRDCEDLVFNTRELTNFAYNTRCKTEAYPYLSEDGQHLYFTNNQSYNWIFYTHKDSHSHVWSVPLPIQIAGFTGSIRSATLSDDHQKLYFVSEKSGMYVCESVDNSHTVFSNLQKIEIIQDKDNLSAPFSCLSFADNGKQMLAYTGNHNQRSMVSYVKTGDYTYSFSSFFSAYNTEMGSLSSDGLSYFFTIKTYKNILFCRSRKSLNESFSNEVTVVKTFENNLRISQVRMNSKGEIVMVLSEEVWDKNDIFFYALDARDSMKTNQTIDLKRLALASVSETMQEPVLINSNEVDQKLKTVEVINQAGKDVCKIEIGNAFPNPAKNHFYIYYHVSGENPLAPMPNLVLIDNSGRVVYTQKLNQLNGEVMITPEHVSSGIYFIRIDYNGLSSSMSKINLSF